MSSTGQESKLKMDSSSMPRAFQWVMASSASSPTLTIGERNKKINMGGVGQWITMVCMPSVFIAAAAGAASIAYDDIVSKSLGSGGFPWWLPIIILAGVYPAVVFLPEAPFAAWEALYDVGYKRVGFGVAFTSAGSLLFAGQPWVLVVWACVLAALVAAVIAFWVCLVRTYGNDDQVSAAAADTE